MNTIDSQTFGTQVDSQSIGLPVSQISNSLETDFFKKVDELNDDKNKFTEKTFQTFINDEQHRANILKIINTFQYGVDTSYVKEKIDYKLVDAFFANDLYKLSMAPVIDACTKHKGGCVVQFRLDLRFNEVGDTEGKKFNRESQDYAKNVDFINDLAKEIDKFKNRTFRQDTIQSFINAPLSNGELPKWKQFWKTKITEYDDKTLISTNRAEIIKYYQVDDRDIVYGDFINDTVILNKIPKPKIISYVDQAPVVLSIFKKKLKDGEIDNGPDVRATGSWTKCSFLETPMMQCVYEVLHTQFLKKNNISYGKWLAQALYRTFRGMSYLENNIISVALFSGRRTGGALFNLLQVYMWNTFMRLKTTIPPVKGNLGSSSFWAIQTLKNLDMTIQIAPSGTHAHELSMTLACLYPELDDKPFGFVGSQILGHLLYKYLSWQTNDQDGSETGFDSLGNGPLPMLTDTIGTEQFLKTALLLQDKGKLALCNFNSARQDSGNLNSYKKLVELYSLKAICGALPSFMASEIDKYADFEEATQLKYATAGVGGALGDSESVIKNDDPMFNTLYGSTTYTIFKASMAVKVVTVFLNGLDPCYTLKTGDGSGKMTYDKDNFDSEDTAKKHFEFDESNRNQNMNQLDILNKTGQSIDTFTLIADKTTEDLKKTEDLKNIASKKQEILDKTLKQIINIDGLLNVAGKNWFEGGRYKTRKNRRKYTKKNKRRMNKRSKRNKNRKSRK